MTDDELKQGEDAWASYEDPFPEWVLDDGEDEDSQEDEA